ncbi:MAG: hypothetical protein JO000_11520 [Alphaproteobacteria bacterium]|nr:hypothetical protein [Alphaproteobacteria bacterium]
MHRIMGALFGLTLLAAPAAAGDGREAATRAALAARHLQQYAAETAAAGGRLDFGRSPAADYFQRVFDQTRFAALPAPAAEDLPWLMDWFSAVRDANNAILYFGADPKQLTTLSQEQIAHNITAYEDQFTTATVFVHKMFPRVLTTAVDFINTLPAKDPSAKVRKDGLARMRAGYVEAVEGSLTFVATGNAKAQNIRAITSALRDNAGVWSKLATPADRGRLAKLIAMARDKAPDEQSSGDLRAVPGTLDAK